MLSLSDLYNISLDELVKGDFKDFAEAAAPWVFFGIGLARALTYLAAGGKDEFVSMGKEGQL